MIWNSKSMNEAASNFLTVAEKLETTFRAIDDNMTVVNQNYEGPGSDKAQATFGVAKENLDEFIKAIKNCATYLRDTVVPDLEKQEQAIADTMSSFTTGQ